MTRIIWQKSRAGHATIFLGSLKRQIDMKKKYLNLRSRCLNGVATTNRGIMQWPTFLGPDHTWSRCGGSVVACPAFTILSHTTQVHISYLHLQNINNKYNNQQIFNFLPESVRYASRDVFNAQNLHTIKRYFTFFIGLESCWLKGIVSRNWGDTRMVSPDRYLLYPRCRTEFLNASIHISI